MLRYRLRSPVQPVHPQRGLCDCWKRRRQIHPEQPNPANHEMVAVHRRRRLRVIHNWPIKRKPRKANPGATDPCQPSKANGKCAVKAEAYDGDTSSDEITYNAESLKRVCCLNGYNGGPETLLSAFAHRLVHMALEDALNDLQALQKIMFPEQECGNTLIGNSGWDFENPRHNSTRCARHAGNNNAELGVDNLAFQHSQSDTETLNCKVGRPWNSCNVFGCQCLDEEKSEAGHNRSESTKRKTFQWNGLTEMVDGGNVTEPETNTYQLTVSSDDCSSCHGSTWGSSTDGSLRFVRKLVYKKYDTKPLLFFIHGVGGSADMWKAQLSFFCHHGYETVAMDLVGHGFSSAPDDPKVYNFHSILADIIILFDRYCKERNVIIGHAYGSSFATALAQQRSRLVSQLVLLSGGGPLPLCQHSISAGLPLCFLSCLGPLVKCGFKRDAFYTPSGRQPKVMEGLDLPRYVVQYLTSGQVWPEGDIAFHKQISVPTLLIYGMKDPFVTLVEECEMERTIPRAFLELIPDAGHMVMIETADKVNEMVYKFLRRWDC